MIELYDNLPARSIESMHRTSPTPSEVSALPALPWGVPDWPVRLPAPEAARRCMFSQPPGARGGTR
jgi:hypothetical protein